MSNRTAQVFVPLLFVWLWSTGFVGARFGLPYIQPFFMLSLRFMITVPCFYLLMRWLKSDGLPWSQIGQQMLVGVLLHGIYLGGVFYAISIGTPAGIAAIIVGLQPILAAFLMRVLFGTRVTFRQISGLFFGFVGLLAVVLGSAEIMGSEFGQIGLNACFVALGAISLSTIIQKKYAAKTPLLIGTMWQYFGALLFVSLMSFMTETQEVVFNWRLVAALGWLVVALSLGAILLLMFMIREGEMARVASYFYLVPPVAALQTWILFDEKLSLLSVVGCLVVLVGVGLVTTERRTARS